MLVTGTSFALGKKCRVPLLPLKVLLPSNFLIPYVYTQTTDPINPWVQYQAEVNWRVPKRAGWSLPFLRVEHPQDVLSALSLSLRPSLFCPPIRNDGERATQDEVKGIPLTATVESGLVLADLSWSLVLLLDPIRPGSCPEPKADA